MAQGNQPTFVDNLLDIENEISLLTEIKDIEDELRTLKHILEDQMDVVKRWMGTRVAREQLSALHEQKDDIESTIRWSQNINGSITDLLDHKNRYANAIEARYARAQAASAEAAEKILLLFTIVTIIFAPLSFLVAFFAVNIEEVPKNFNQQQFSGLGIMYRYVIGVGIGMSCFIIAIAFYYQWVWTRAKRLWQDHRKRRSKREGTEQKRDQSVVASHGSGKSTATSSTHMLFNRGNKKTDEETGTALREETAAGG